MRSITKTTIKQLFIASFLLLLTWRSSVQAMIPVQPPTSVLQLQQVFSQIYQDERTWTYYSYAVPPQNKSFFNSTQLVIRLDVLNDWSDPDIFISMTNKYPTSQVDSGWSCEKHASQVCIVPKSFIPPSIVSSVLYFSVSCIQNCTYQLQILFAPILDVSDGTSLTRRIEWQQVVVFSYFIPDLSLDGPTQSASLLIETVARNIGPMNLYFAWDSYLSMLQDPSYTVVTDQGVSGKFTSNSSGWCTNCYVYFLLCVNAPTQYQITASTSARLTTLLDQSTVAQQLNQQDPECYSFIFQKASNDGLFLVTTLEGQHDLELYQGLNSGSDIFGNASLSKQTRLFKSRHYHQVGLILRSQDRYRMGSPNPSAIQLCSTPWTDTSIKISSSQQYWLGKFDAQDDILYTFLLDTQDYVTFAYTNEQLTQYANITLQVSAIMMIADASAPQVLPRVFYTVCNSSSFEECSMSSSQAFGDDSSISLLNATLTSPQQMTGIINHSPLNCPKPTSCYYLIAVSNAAVTGPQACSFQANINTASGQVKQLQLFQQYNDIVPLQIYTYYQITFAPFQLQNMQISQVLVNVSQYIGGVKVFISTTNQYPSPQNYEQMSDTTLLVHSLSVGTVGRNLNNFTVYVAVLGLYQSQIQVRTDAQYQMMNPIFLPSGTKSASGANITVLVQNTSSSSTQTIISVNSSASSQGIPANTSNLTVYPIPQKDGQTVKYTIYQNSTDMIFYYQPSASQSDQKTILFYPTILSKLNNSQITFNVTYGQYQWNNNIVGLTLTPDDWNYDPNCLFIISVRANFNFTVPSAPKINPNQSQPTNTTSNQSSQQNNSTSPPSTNSSTNSTGNASSLSNLTFSKGESGFKGGFQANSTSSGNSSSQSSNTTGTGNSSNSTQNGTNKNQSIQPLQPPAPMPNISFTFLVQSVVQQSDYISYTQCNVTYSGYANRSVILYTTLLMDSNATYVFTMYNSMGLPAMMVDVGPLKSTYLSISDETSYDYATNTTDYPETTSLSVTPRMRQSIIPACLNGSYPIKGGNNNCTMTIAIQCDQVCFFNFWIRAISQQNNAIQMPQLLSEGIPLDKQTVFVGSQSQYFIPFVRNQSIGDLAIALSKLSNDTFMAVRIIPNAYLPYGNWSYPTIASNDAISRNPNQTYEVILITNATLISKCPMTTSCAILITIFSNLPASSGPQSSSSFRLTFFGQNRKLGNTSVVSNTILNPNKVDFYFITINNTLPWKQLLTVSSPENGADCNLYVSVFDGQIPDSSNYDFRGNRLGSDVILLSSNSSFFQQTQTPKPTILLIVSVQATGPNTTYSLLNWGPNGGIDSSLFTFTDLQLSQGNASAQNFSLPSRIAKPTNNFLMFRYFNKAGKDLIFNLSTTNASVILLANFNPYLQYNENSFFNTPIMPQLSSITAQGVTRGYQLRINQTTNNKLYCQFCWIYIAVFQNNSQPSLSTQITMRVSEIPVDLIPTVSPISLQTFNLQVVNQTIQFKFQFDCISPSYTALISNQTNMTMVISIDPNYTGNPSSIIYQGRTNPNSSSLVFRWKEGDSYFAQGITYYVSIVANQNQTQATVDLGQFRRITYLENGTSLSDFMLFRDDFVKYYYFKFPLHSMLNQTYTVSISGVTPGFKPSIYALSNEIINNSYSFKNLLYPTLTQFTVKNEQHFTQASQDTYSLSFSTVGMNKVIMVPKVTLQNVTTNRTTQVSVTVNVTNPKTKKNTTQVVLQNQTVQVTQLMNVTTMTASPSNSQQVFTVAVYLNNFGMTDVLKAEYQISCSVVQTGKILRSGHRDDRGDSLQSEVQDQNHQSYVKQMLQYLGESSLLHSDTSSDDSIWQQEYL